MRRCARLLVLVSLLLFVFAAPAWAVTNTWSPAGMFVKARGFHTETLLPSGKVLVAGGFNSTDGYLASAALYDEQPVVVIKQWDDGT